MSRPGLHPEHPTAVGGLPASKPGLNAGTHDLRKKIAHHRGGLAHVPLVLIPTGVMSAQHSGPDR